MKEVFLGEIIRQRRQDLGLTQDQLSEGICEQVTLCRFENGLQMPSRNRICALLQRLGLPDNRYYALLSRHEEQIKSLQEEIHANNVSYERASEANRSKIRAQTLEKLRELERIMEPDDPIIRQYILKVKATIGSSTGAYSPNERHKMLMEAIRLTVPRFNLKTIGQFRYSVDEVRIINQIAVTYSQTGQKKEAIDIYRQLLQYIERNNQGLAGYAGQFCLIAHNYAIQLAKERQHNEAIALSEQGWQVCVTYGHYQFLPDFLAILAECHYFRGDREMSTKFYCQAYCLYQATTDEHNRAIIAREMKERLGMDPPC